MNHGRLFCRLSDLFLYLNFLKHLSAAPHRMFVSDLTGSLISVILLFRVFVYDSDLVDSLTINFYFDLAKAYLDGAYS